MKQAAIVAVLLATAVGAYAAFMSVVDDSRDLIGTGALPTCDSSRRGKQWFVEGGVGVADTMNVCVKGVVDTYGWSSLL